MAVVERNRVNQLRWAYGLKPSQIAAKLNIDVTTVGRLLYNSEQDWFKAKFKEDQDIRRRML